MNRADEALESWYLTGPTAAGKTTVGVLLAQRLDAEIISLDSMAVYRGMDVGTAKPPQSARGGIPHHLIDVAEPTEDYSLARFLDEARQALSEIRARGRKALFVGGTPLYLKAMLRDLFGSTCRLGASPLAASRSRAATARLPVAAVGPGRPPSAKRLHPHDTRRLIRAIEVFEKTGRPISA